MPVQRFGRPKDVALEMGLSVRMIRKLMAAGELPYSKIGRAVLIDFDDVSKFVASRKQAR